MTAIVQKDNPVLRKKAVLVTPAILKSARLKRIITLMQTALAEETDGVALAAPQIGESLRLFIVSPKALRVTTKAESKTTGAPGKEAPKEKEEPEKPGLICINPTITKRSKKTRLLDEGCLSVRPYYGKVRRSLKTTLEALDGNGKKFTRGASGLLAQIFQHEVDHLDGILFIDKAKELYTLPLPQKHTPHRPKHKTKKI